MIETELSRRIKAHAVECYPHESCGFVVDGHVNGRDISGTYVPLANTHSDPTNAARVRPEDFLKYEGRIVAFVHSHPDGEAAPSAADMVSQARLNIPYIIVATNGTNCSEPFEFGDCLPRFPLMGRPFRHAVTDCYELMRDYYDAELDLKLQSIPRDWCWWKDGLDLYQDYFKPTGFRRLQDGEEPQQHDCFFMCLGSSVPNHGGIYLGNGRIMHHMGSTRNGAYSPTHLSTTESGVRYYSLKPIFVRYEGL